MRPISGWKEYALADLISLISEEWCAAGWAMGIEFVIWNYVVSDKPSCEILFRTDALEHLRAMSAEIGGWVTCDDRFEQLAFVDLAEWEAMVKGRDGNGRSTVKESLTAGGAQ